MVKSGGASESQKVIGQNDEEDFQAYQIVEVQVQVQVQVQAWFKGERNGTAEAGREAGGLRGKSRNGYD